MSKSSVRNMCQSKKGFLMIELVASLAIFACFLVLISEATSKISVCQSEIGGRVKLFHQVADLQERPSGLTIKLPVAWQGHPWFQGVSVEAREVRALQGARELTLYL
jgi:hypothetical protein